MIQRIQLAALDNESVTCFVTKDKEIYVDSIEAEIILDIFENTLPRIGTKFLDAASDVKRHWTQLSVIVGYMQNHPLRIYASGRPYRV